MKLKRTLQLIKVLYIILIIQLVTTIESKESPINQKISIEIQSKEVKVPNAKISLLRNLISKEATSLKKGDLNSLKSIYRGAYLKGFQNSIKKYGAKTRSKEIKEYFSCVTKVEVNIASYDKNSLLIGVQYFCKDKSLDVFSNLLELKNNQYFVIQSCVGYSLDCD